MNNIAAESTNTYMQSGIPPLTSNVGMLTRSGKNSSRMKNKVQSIKESGALTSSKLTTMDTK